MRASPIKTANMHNYTNCNNSAIVVPSRESMQLWHWSRLAVIRRMKSATCGYTVIVIRYFVRCGVFTYRNRFWCQNVCLNGRICHITTGLVSGNTACMTHLAEVRVEISYAGAQFLHVLREKMVGVGDAVVKVTHLVVRESPEQDRQTKRYPSGVRTMQMRLGKKLGLAQHHRSSRSCVTVSASILPLRLFSHLSPPSPGAG